MDYFAVRVQAERARVEREATTFLPAPGPDRSAGRNSAGGGELTRLEHTAFDLVLTTTVAENEVPILPVVSLDLSRVTENSILTSVLMTCS